MVHGVDVNGFGVSMMMMPVFGVGVGDYFDSMGYERTLEVFEG